MIYLAGYHTRSIHSFRFHFLGTRHFVTLRPSDSCFEQSFRVLKQFSNPSDISLEKIRVRHRIGLYFYRPMQHESNNYDITSNVRKVGDARYLERWSIQLETPNFCFHSEIPCIHLNFTFVTNNVCQFIDFLFSPNRDERVSVIC